MMNNLQVIYLLSRNSSLVFICIGSEVSVDENGRGHQMRSQASSIVHHESIRILDQFPKN